MLIDEYHPEDIKAAIRKRFGSLLAFERARGLKRQSVTEILRGRRSARTEREVRRVLEQDEKWAIGKSISADSSKPIPAAHRLNEAAE